MGFIDVGFTEIIVILVVILIVVGPDKLPGMARSIGNLFRTFRQASQNLTSTINRELSLEEDKKEITSAISDAVNNPLKENAASEADPAKAGTAPKKTIKPAKALPKKRAKSAGTGSEKVRQNSPKRSGRPRATVSPTKTSKPKKTPIAKATVAPLTDDEVI